MAQGFDDRLPLADVYAGALFDLASQAGTVADIRAELAELARLHLEDSAFAAFLGSAAISTDQRRASLERMLRGRVSDLTLNTLLVMNAHGRADLLEPLARAFTLRVEHAAGEIECVAATAVPLDDAQRAAVRDLAGEISGKRPLVEFVVDPTLLGGLVLSIGDFRFDNSLRTKLARTRRHLFARADRGLPVGTGA